MRDKEVAMNYMCSLLTPVDPETEKIYKIINETRRTRINHELAREMMTELKPPNLDFDDLGTSYHANYEDKVKNETIDIDEKDSKTLFVKNFLGKEEESKNEEMEKLAAYELEKDTGQNALKDFEINSYPDFYGSKQDPEDFKYPVNFYDNDDGFWDEYIEKKNQRYDDIPFLTRRWFLKH